MANTLEPMRSPVPSISGPSMLGLNQPSADQPSANQPRANQPIFNQNGFNQPSMDSLRETAFSGLDSFFEPEQPRTGGRRILLLVMLLAALGGAGWWTYTNYLGVTESRKPQAATSSADEAPAEKASEKPSTTPTPAARDAAPAPVRDRGSSQAVVSAKAPESQPNSASPPDSDTTGKTVDAEVKAPAPAVPVPVPKIVTPGKRSAKPEAGVTSAKASTPPPPVAADTGDAAFRKGEAYLYGRGVPENCDEAVKYLKAASAKSNAKSRSAFGTMYATGHCVPRDLPTSYLWFALALRVDPNNQILEKDLSAVWNQMTPPERQMATRMKR